jgi:hypothetical protein
MREIEIGENLGCVKIFAIAMFALVLLNIFAR